MQGQDLYVMAPTFLTYLSAALKNTNADFTKVPVQLTLSVKAISNVALRIVIWHPISHVMLQTVRNSTVVTMVCQSEKKNVKLSTILLFFLLRTKIFELPGAQFRWLYCERMWTSRLPMHVQANWYVKLYFSSLQECCVCNEDKTSLVLKYCIIKILLCLRKIFEKMQLICMT